MCDSLGFFRFCYQGLASLGNHNKHFRHCCCRTSMVCCCFRLSLEGVLCKCPKSAKLDTGHERQWHQLPLSAGGMASWHFQKYAKWWHQTAHKTGLSKSNFSGECKKAVSCAVFSPFQDGGKVRRPTTMEQTQEEMTQPLDKEHLIWWVLKSACIFWIRPIRPTKRSSEALTPILSGHSLSGSSSRRGKSRVSDQEWWIWLKTYLHPHSSQNAWQLVHSIRDAFLFGAGVNRPKDMTLQTHSCIGGEHSSLLILLSQKFQTHSLLHWVLYFGNETRKKFAAKKGKTPFPGMTVWMPVWQCRAIIEDLKALIVGKSPRQKQWNMCGSWDLCGGK